MNALKLKIEGPLTTITICMDHAFICTNHICSCRIPQSIPYISALASLKHKVGKITLLGAFFGAVF